MNSQILSSLTFDWLLWKHIISFVEMQESAKEWQKTWPNKYIILYSLWLSHYNWHSTPLETRVPPQNNLFNQKNCYTRIHKYTETHMRTHTHTYFNIHSQAGQNTLIAIRFGALLIPTYVGVTGLSICSLSVSLIFKM